MLGSMAEHGGRYGFRSADSPTTDEPFAAIFLCSADRKKVDKRTRSKWSRVVRYAAEYKTSAEPLAAFIQRKGGINKCAERFTRCYDRGWRPRSSTEPFVARSGRHSFSGSVMWSRRAISLGPSARTIRCRSISRSSIGAARPRIDRPRHDCLPSHIHRCLENMESISLVFGS
jgi:hypothetical protein